MATRVLTGTNRSIERLIASTFACSDKPYSNVKTLRNRKDRNQKATPGLPTSVP